MPRTTGRMLAAGIVAAAVPLGGAARAQQAVTLTGQVTVGGTRQPLGDVQVYIPSLNVGTQTRADGRYTIAVPARAVGTSVLVTARRIGYQAASVNVSLRDGTVTQDFSLSVTATQLATVTVTTALGVERQKRELGVAAQTVSGQDLTPTRQPNLVNALSGKVAGVKVVGSTNFGGSARIVIRGESSILGNNQPLFVVDGVPVDNSTFTNATQARGYGGFDYGNALQDLNPDDIESVSVLKGPAAAALYGSRASNGAVVITTKSGRTATRGTFQVSGTSNTTFETVAKLPDYQNQYGQGANGEFEWVDGAGSGTNDGEDASWGPKLSPDSMKVQWFSNGQPAPWVAHPNNVRDFFQTGRTLNNSISATGSNDRASFRLSAGQQDQRGIVPTSSLQRVTAGFNGTAQLTDKLTANASGQVLRFRTNNLPGTGYDELNPMMGFVWFGRQVDVDRLRQHYADSAGNQVNWNYNYHNNPFWNLNENHNFSDRNRFLGNASVTYRPVPWLSVLGRLGTDFYRDNRVLNIAPGWIGGYGEGYGITNGDYSQGGFTDESIFVSETNPDFLLSTTPAELSRFGLGALKVSGSFGGSRRVRTYNQDVAASDALVIPGVYNSSNSATQYTPIQYREKRQLNSLYGTANFAYANWLFVDVTGRNDWSSTLPATNNSYFYPSVASSFVFTDLLPALRFGGALSYGKLRGAVTRVGSDADPYLLQLQYQATSPFGSQPRYFVPNTVVNPNLKPEQTKAWEVGTELGFLNGRLGLDATYYQKRTTNQILTASVSTASGYSAAAVNAGQLSNKGVELQLTANPVRLANSFRWDVTANYAQNRSRLDALAQNLETVQIGSRFFNTSIEARVGQPYGAIVGYAARRDSAGNLILNARNLPQKSALTQVLGNVQPTWTGGLLNAFRYRNFDASVLLDARIGGQLWSATNRFGTYSGILASTLVGRDTGLTITGVNAKGEKVNAKVRAEDYFKTIDGIEQYFVYDASFVKLRELRVGYNVPRSLTGRLNGAQLNVAFIGRNLWMSAKAPNIDPETALSAGNQQGIEFGQLPTTRSLGFQITVTP